LIKHQRARLKLWRRTANEGDAGAQFLLGASYAIGIEPDLNDGQFPPSLWPNDIDRAVDWWGRSALQGFAEAQLQLGVIFLLSEHDEHAAAAWLLRAASQGNKEAMFHLGEISGGVVFDTAEKLGLNLPRS
jgi:uncharacterized protein